jgi:hypothetical protein
VPEIQKIDLMFDQSDLVEAVSQVTWPVTPASAVHNADRIFEPDDGPVYLSELEHATVDDTETHKATNLAAAAIDANLAATKAFERRAELPSNSTIQLTYAATIAAADAMIADPGMIDMARNESKAATDLYNAAKETNASKTANATVDAAEKAALESVALLQLSSTSCRHKTFVDTPNGAPINNLEVTAQTHPWRSNLRRT